MRSLLFILILLPLGLFSQGLSEMRSLYLAAVDDEVSAIALSDLKALGGTDLSALEEAYLGASYMLQAGHVKQVGQKRSLFIQGRKLMENAIDRDFNSVEIRLLRMSIQENSPKLLKYKANLSEDKDFLLAHSASTPDTELRNMIQDYASGSMHFTAEERERL